MKIGVTGAKGFVGSELVKRGAVEINADLLNEDALSFEISSNHLDTLIHAAALTSVDTCEKNAKEAFQVNVGGTMNVVNICSEIKLPIIFLSTDHVFSGKHSFVPSEVVDPDPVNTYGLTKYAAEAMINTADVRTLIIRSSKLINGQWLKKDLDLLYNGDFIDAPTFIHKCFLHVSFFVDAIMNIIETGGLKLNEHDILHIAASVRLSYYDFWREVCYQAGVDSQQLIKRTVKFDGDKLAPRPFRGGLDSSKAYELGIIKPIPVKESIAKALEEYYEIKKSEN